MAPRVNSSLRNTACLERSLVHPPFKVDIRTMFEQLSELVAIASRRHCLQGGSVLSALPVDMSAFFQEHFDKLARNTVSRSLECTAKFASHPVTVRTLAEEGIGYR